jgi:hypothetical protein
MSAFTEVPIAHAAHWYHAALYLSPVLLVVIALWVSGQREKRAGYPDDDADE